MYKSLSYFSIFQVQTLLKRGQLYYDKNLRKYIFNPSVFKSLENLLVFNSM